MHIKGLRARENFHIDDEQLDMFLVQFDLKRADKCVGALPGRAADSRTRMRTCAYARDGWHCRRE